MKYSAIIVIEKFNLQKIEEKIIFLSGFFDEVILVCEDLVSIAHLKPLCVKPFNVGMTNDVFLNFLHAGLFASQNEWCFVCGTEHDLDLNKIKKMKGYLSKSQVVLWSEDVKYGFYRKHFVKKIEELLEENKNIHDFLKTVRTKIIN